MVVSKTFSLSVVQAMHNAHTLGHSTADQQIYKHFCTMTSFDLFLKFAMSFLLQIGLWFFDMWHWYEQRSFFHISQSYLKPVYSTSLKKYSECLDQPNLNQIGEGHCKMTRHGMTQSLVYLPSASNATTNPPMTDLCCESGVGVLTRSTDAELLRQTCHLLYKSYDRLELFVSLTQRLLELLMGTDQTL